MVGDEYHVEMNPGTRFSKDLGVSIDVDPQNPNWKRLCPRPVMCPEGGFRLYFMAEGSFCPPGNRGVIVSACSNDGAGWSWDVGVRIGADHSRARDRALAPDVVPLADGSWRMYFEARCTGHNDVIMSARSTDMLAWEIEEGVRVEGEHSNEHVGTPSVVPLPDGRWRLYHHMRDPARYVIVSSLSSDGISFQRELGTRIAQTSDFETHAAYAPHVIACSEGWRMYYSGWSEQPRIQGVIMTAESKDGLFWEKHKFPVLWPDRAKDAAHCSEPSCLRLPDGRWRLYYEALASDGTSRILSATSSD